MNPNTADYLNDRAETAATKAEERLGQLTRDILDSPGLLNEAVGEYLNQRPGDRLFSILSKCCAKHPGIRVFGKLRGHIYFIAEWYAIRLIAKEDKVAARHPLPKRQAD